MEAAIGNVERETSPGPMKCFVCKSIMVTDGIQKIGSDEVLRFRCIKNCRGSDLEQERHNKDFPLPREFNWKMEALAARNHQLTMRHWRTMVCMFCGKKVHGLFYNQARTCSDECQEGQRRKRSGRRNFLRNQKRKSKRAQRRKK